MASSVSDARFCRRGKAKTSLSVESVLFMLPTRELLKLKRCRIIDKAVKTNRLLSARIGYDPDNVVAGVVANEDASYPEKLKFSHLDIMEAVNAGASSSFVIHMMGNHCSDPGFHVTCCRVFNYALQKGARAYVEKINQAYPYELCCEDIRLENLFFGQTVEFQEWFLALYLELAKREFTDGYRGVYGLSTLLRLIQKHDSLELLEFLKKDADVQREMQQAFGCLFETSFRPGKRTFLSVLRVFPQAIGPFIKDAVLRNDVAFFKECKTAIVQKLIANADINKRSFIEQVWRIPVQHPTKKVLTCIKRFHKAFGVPLLPVCWKWAFEINRLKYAKYLHSRGVPLEAKHMFKLRGTIFRCLKAKTVEFLFSQRLLFTIDDFVGYVGNNPSQARKYEIHRGPLKVEFDCYECSYINQFSPDLQLFVLRLAKQFL